MNLRNPLFLFIAVLAIAISSCSKYNKVLKSSDYDYKLKMANEYYENKQYRQAQTLYEELFTVFKGTPQFEELYYRYAYCAYHMKDFASAENLFDGFLNMFPNSTKAEEIEYMEAYSYYKESPKAELDQTNTIKAIGMMQTFINTHPGSEKNKEAQEIIDAGVKKLETKELKSCQLYYNMTQYKAAAIAFTSLINNYPDSPKAEEYKLMIIKSYYKYATMSIEERREERYAKVVQEVQDFQDRYPESKLLKEAERYLTLSSTKNKVSK
jgi:outer membrane protein assembly factor BamD